MYSGNIYFIKEIDKVDLGLINSGDVQMYLLMIRTCTVKKIGKVSLYEGKFMSALSVCQDICTYTVVRKF